MILATSLVLGKALQYVITGIVIAAVLGLISFFAAQESKKHANSRSVAYPTIMLIFTCFGWLLFGGATIWMLAIGQGMNALFLAGVTTVLLVPLTMECLMFRITWDDNFIYSRSPWRKKRTIPLASVESWKLSEAMQMYYIYTQFDGKIRISQYARNINDLLAAIDEFA